MKKMTLIFFLFLLSSLASPAFAEDGNMLFTTSSHGNLTLEGPTGMFLNPTSTVLKKNELIIQYCAAILKFNNSSLIDHYTIASYGITDWLELGATGRLWDMNSGPTYHGSQTGGGPFARLRILKEEKLLPEFSVGAVSVQGDPLVRKDTIFFAASKGMRLKERNLPFDLRLHAGIRQFWFGQGEGANRPRQFYGLTQDVGGSGINDHVAYLGGEISLPKSLYLVSEVSTQPTGATRTPYSVGLQFRSSEGYGFSLAGIQTGNQAYPGIMIGIGINFN
jgi:hypothetical protein